MSYRREVVVALVSAALGFGLGFLAASPPPSNPPARLTAGAVPLEPGTPVAAVYDALLIRDPLARIATLAQVLAKLGPNDVQDVRLVFRNFVTAPADPEIAVLAQWWARHDPAAAFAWAQHSREGHHPMVISAVLRTWAQQDPAAANKALVRLRARDTLVDAMIATVLGWEDGGHADLPAFIFHLPQGINLQRTVDALARRKVLRDGPAEAFRWAESLPPEDGAGGLKINTMRRVAGAAAETDPASAMAFAEKHGEELDGRGMYGRVGTTLARRHGERAMQWLAGLPEGLERRNAVQETYREWLKQNRGAAMRWMRSQQTEPWLDPAIRLFALALAKSNPELGLAWADRISLEDRRSDATLRIATVWMGTDPVAARTWIDSADVPEELKQRILDPPQKPKRTKRNQPKPRKQRTPGPQGEAESPPRGA